MTLESVCSRECREVTGETRSQPCTAPVSAAPVAQRTPANRTARRSAVRARASTTCRQSASTTDGSSGIRWAERLVVMAYPDEGGHHLEVVQPGNGVRGAARCGPRESRRRAGRRACFAPGSARRKVAPRDDRRRLCPVRRPGRQLRRAGASLGRLRDVARRPRACHWTARGSGLCPSGSDPRGRSSSRNTTTTSATTSSR